MFGLLERDDNTSNVRATVIPDTSRYTLVNQVNANVEKGAQLFTDTHPGYDGLKKEYAHESVDHSAKEYVRGHVHTNNIENFWSIWKRCIKGTHVHISPEHMNRYLDEEMFRYNNRTNDDDDAGRFLMAANSVLGRRLTYKELTGKI